VEKFDDRSRRPYWLDRTGAATWDRPLFLPAGWGARVDEQSGDTWYQHEPSGEKSWKTPPGASPVPLAAAAAASSGGDGAAAAAAPEPELEPDEPKPTVVLLVDFTALSDGAIHNRFDKNAVNDPDAKRAMLKKVEAEYKKYKDDTNMLADGVVHPCAESVYRAALSQLRDDHPGHFFAPVFPP
jgi:hypothetical protein